MTKFKIGDTAISRIDVVGQFTKGKTYVVGGEFHNGYAIIGVTADNDGKPNGMHPKYFGTLESQSFENWFAKYYPQEYGYNSEFRNIVMKHAERAYQAGKESNESL